MSLTRKSVALEVESLEDRLTPASINPVTVISNYDYRPLFHGRSLETKVSLSPTTLTIEGSGYHDTVTIHVVNNLLARKTYLTITNEIRENTVFGTMITRVLMKKESFRVDISGMYSLLPKTIEFQGKEGHDYFRYFGAEEGGRFARTNNFSIHADGGVGDDKFWGANLGDILQGGDGNDWLYGLAGNDILFGQDGTDHLRGGSGDDILLGGNGFDVLHGDMDLDARRGWFAGNDVLDGGRDGVKDELTGGPGIDSFAVYTKDGPDNERIIDYRYEHQFSQPSYASGERTTSQPSEAAVAEALRLWPSNTASIIYGFWKPQ